MSGYTENNLSIATLSGWGQSFDSLDNVSKGAFHINYSKMPSIEHLFTYLENHHYDLLVGWSLGGQIALRLVQSGVLKPKLLVLIAVPFKFVSNDEEVFAIKEEEFLNFKNKYKENVEKTLRQFNIAIAKNDIFRSQIAKSLQRTTLPEKKYLEYWLSQLEDFSCNDIDPHKIPRLVFFHGEKDSIVNLKQLDLFKKNFNNSRFEIFKNRGHMPHIGNEKYIKDIIKEEISCLV